MRADKAMLVRVYECERGSLFLDVDSKAVGIDVDDNAVVRPGQEFRLRNTSPVEFAAVKMVIVTHQQGM